MKRPHPIRDAAIALTTLSAIPTPPEWLAGDRVQAAGWFPVMGGVIAAVGYGIVKLAENSGLLQRAPFTVACVVVAVWFALTWGLHWRALSTVTAQLLAMLARGRGTTVEPSPRMRTAAAAITAGVAALEAATIGSFLVMHQSPVLLIPLLARYAATAAAWLGKPVPGDNPGRKLFGKPSLTAIAVSALTLALVVLALWTGFQVRGLALAVFAMFVALAVPHLMSLPFEGVTVDVLEASVVLTEVIVFVAFALSRLVH